MAVGSAGDAKGWRARHHREHAEGDYRNPPPAGMYDEMYRRSQELMTRPGIHLSREARVLACRTMVEALLFHHVDVVDFCVGATHYHGLIRCFPIDNEVWRIIRLEGRTQNRLSRHLMGIAKKESARALSREGLAEAGGVWAGGCGRRWIKNRGHQLTVARYIRAHAGEGRRGLLVALRSPLLSPGTAVPGLGASDCACC
jgi:hypothetical protein